MFIGIIFLLVCFFFLMSCIAFGLFYLIRKTYQNRRTIIQLPFVLFKKLISLSNVLVMFITLGLAAETTHIFLKLPRVNITKYTQFIMSPHSPYLLILLFIFFQRLCRFIYKRFLSSINISTKFSKQLASLWWPCMILMFYIFNVTMLYGIKSSPINVNNENIIIIFTFICFWIVASSAIRRYKKFVLSFN